MGLSYYTSRGIEPYVTPDNKINIRKQTDPGTDAYSRPTATPEQSAQMQYQRTHSPQQVQAQQIEQQRARNITMGVSQSERNRASYIQASRNKQVLLSNGQQIVGYLETPKDTRTISIQVNEPTIKNDKMEPIGLPLYSSLIGISDWVRNTAGLKEQVSDADLNKITGNNQYSTAFLQFGRGAFNTAAGFPEFIGYGLAGTEAAIRKPELIGIKKQGIDPVVPAMLVYGVAEGQWRAMTTDPFGFAGGVAVGVLAGKAVGGAGTRYFGIKNTLGREFVPAYGKTGIAVPPSAGYPWTRQIMNLKQTRRSFKEGRLIDVVAKNPAGTVDLANLPKNSLLPDELPLTGDKVRSYTAHEAYEVRTPGDVYVIKHPDPKQLSPTDLPGYYGAPVIEQHFHHVAGQIKAAIGFDTKIIKSPSVIRAEIGGIEGFPRNIEGNFPAMREYIADFKKSGGKAVRPKTKREAEIVIPAGTEMEVIANKYYTKVGGIGKNQWGGIRTPISQQRATGRFFTPEEMLAKEQGIPTSKSSSDPYYRYSSPIVNLANPLSYTGLSKVQSKPSPPPDFRRAPDKGVRSPVKSTKFKRPYDIYESQPQPVTISSPPPSKSRISYPGVSSGFSSSGKSSGGYSGGYSGGSSGGGSSGGPSGGRNGIPSRYVPPYLPRPVARYVPLASTAPKKSDNRSRMWSGRWKGTTITNKVIGFKEFFGDIKAPKEKTKKRKWGII